MRPCCSVLRKRPQLLHPPPLAPAVLALRPGQLKLRPPPWAVPAKLGKDKTCAQAPRQANWCASSVLNSGAARSRSPMHGNSTELNRFGQEEDLYMRASRVA